jgi:putative endonuclease
MYYVYILKSETTGRYYVGYTSSLEDRLSNHNSGRNISTKPGVPWKIVHSEQFEGKNLAWLRERQIKSYKGGEAFKKLVK